MQFADVKVAHRRRVAFAEGKQQAEVQNGGLGGRIAEQAECRQGDHEELGRGATGGRICHAEGAPQRIRLGGREMRDPLHHGLGQQVQPRERQMGLRLCT